MSSRPAPGFERLGLACVAAGALAEVWAFLALQAPGSPWHAPGYPNAVARLALHAWVVGLATLVLAPRAPSRWLLAVASLGAASSLGALAASAATGWLGTQLSDARAGSAAILLARLAGAALLLVALAAAVRLRATTPRAGGG